MIKYPIIIVETYKRFIRQQEFISSSEQDRLAESHVLVAGCGAGSAVAQNLARLGIGNITLVDPDTVELHNLNRQDFTEGDLGRNKAEALASRILSINSDIKTRVIHDRVSSENASDLVSSSDIVIDMIDVAAPYDMISLHKEAQKAKKPVVTGFDLGETAISYVFDYRDPSQMTIQRFLGFDDNVSSNLIDSLPNLSLSAQFVLGRVDRKFDSEQEAAVYYNSFFDSKLSDLRLALPDDFHPIVDKLLSGKLDYIPQVNTAAAQLGVIHSAVVKELALGRKVKTAPESVRLDVLSLIK